MECIPQQTWRRGTPGGGGEKARGYVPLGESAAAGCRGAWRQRREGTGYWEGKGGEDGEEREGKKMREGEVREGRVYESRPHNCQISSLVDSLEVASGGGGEDRLAVGEGVKGELAMVGPKPTVAHPSKWQGGN